MPGIGTSMVAGRSLRHEVDQCRVDAARTLLVRLLTTAGAEEVTVVGAAAAVRVDRVGID